MKKVKIIAVVTCCKGNVRKMNQDNFFLNGAHRIEKLMEDIHYRLETKDSLQMYAVFDGMGGEYYGDEAALISIQVAERYRKSLQGKEIEDIHKYLERYFKDANNQICGMMDERKVNASGSTAAVIWFYKDLFYGANVGDSRIYLFRNNRLEQLSIDHTEQALLEKLDLGMGQSGQNLGLTQYLGIRPEEMVIQPYYFKLKPKHKDILLLCSDGLTRYLNNEAICQILTSSKNIESAKERLLQGVVEAKGKDNITIMLLDIRKGWLSSIGSM